MIVPEQSRFAPGLGALLSCNCDGTPETDSSCPTFCASIQSGTVDSLFDVEPGTGGWTSKDTPQTSINWAQVVNSGVPVVVGISCKAFGIACPTIGYTPGVGYFVDQPWYTTTAGQLGIVAAIGLLGVGGYYALKKN